MKIAILQFNPKLREVQNNIDHANSFLQGVQPGDVDLLVLPELAFTGYNYPDFKSIRPYLESTADGPSTKWAIETAKRLNCIVSVGYPEITNELFIPSPGSPQSGHGDHGPFGNASIELRTYNALATVSPSGQLLAHYRKTNLYYTDATWCWPNPEGFQTVELPLDASECIPARDDEDGAPTTTLSAAAAASTRTAFAICMDLNPHQFIAPISAFELANHVLSADARLLIASNAWLSHESPEELLAAPGEFSYETLSYWLARLEPLIFSDQHVSPMTAGERIVVIANRVGVEEGICRACSLTRGRPPVEIYRNESEESVMLAETSAEPTEDTISGGGIISMEARYAGSSCVIGLLGDGKMKVYGILGRSEEKLLIVDTRERPRYMGNVPQRSDD